MFRRRFTKASAIAFSLAISCVALQGATEWTAGLDLTVESTFGLSGSARSGKTMHGTALAHIDWEQPRDEVQGVTLSATASVLGVAGRGPTERFVGDFLAISNTEAYPSARLYAWWLQADDASWSLRVGALLADEEFAGTDGGGGFLNSAFGWPAFISTNTVNTGPAYFVPALGARLARTWGDSVAWRIGIYDGDTFDSPDGDPTINSDGLHYQLGGKQGWFMISELDWSPDNSKTRLKAGAWLHTADFKDLLKDANGEPFAISGNPPRTYSSNHGFYASIERTILGEAGEPGSVDGFVRAGFSPPDRNAVSHAFDLGVAWTGPLPGRGGDVLSIGFVRAQLSDHFADAALLENPSLPAPDYEQVVEASYILNWSDNVSIQPDLQYIFHPGGSTAQSDALVFLIRVNTSF